MEAYTGARVDAYTAFFLHRGGGGDLKRGKISPFKSAN